ncbi:uncharacterized protein LOC101864596 isoform X2 [Aplysia californica]|nr:uncharacterized protein LOC101864596 isoform X2 [Aplysia californica]
MPESPSADHQLVSSRRPGLARAASIPGITSFARNNRFLGVRHQPYSTRSSRRSAREVRGENVWRAANSRVTKKPKVRSFNDPNYPNGRSDVIRSWSVNHIASALKEKLVLQVETEKTSAGDEMTVHAQTAGLPASWQESETKEGKDIGAQTTSGEAVDDEWDNATEFGPRDILRETSDKIALKKAPGGLNMCDMNQASTNIERSRSGKYNCQPSQGRNFLSLRTPQQSPPLQMPTPRIPMNKVGTVDTNSLTDLTSASRVEREVPDRYIAMNKDIDDDPNMDVGFFGDDENVEDEISICVPSFGDEFPDELRKRRTRSLKSKLQARRCTQRRHRSEHVQPTASFLSSEGEDEEEASPAITALRKQDTLKLEDHDDNASEAELERAVAAPRTLSRVIADIDNDLFLDLYVSSDDDETEGLLSCSSNSNGDCGDSQTLPLPSCTNEYRGLIPLREDFCCAVCGAMLESLPLFSVHDILNPVGLTSHALQENVTDNDLFCPQCDCGRCVFNSHNLMDTRGHSAVHYLS